MGMLEEYSPDPAGYREQKHVVAKRVRPIRNSHPGFVAGDQTPAANQERKASRRHHSIPMQQFFRKRIGGHRSLMNPNAPKTVRSPAPTDFEAENPGPSRERYTHKDRCKQSESQENSRAREATAASTPKWSNSRDSLAPSVP